MEPDIVDLVSSQDSQAEPAQGATHEADHLPNYEHLLSCALLDVATQDVATQQSLSNVYVTSFGGPIGLLAAFSTAQHSRHHEAQQVLKAAAALIPILLVVDTAVRKLLVHPEDHEFSELAEIFKQGEPMSTILPALKQTIRSAMEEEDLL